MKKVDNYKNIRRKATIIGLSSMFFMIFFSTACLAVMFLIGGITLIKLVSIATFIGLSYGTCYFLSNNDVTRSLFNNKFPKEISNLTEDEY